MPGPLPFGLHMFLKGITMGHSPGRTGAPALPELAELAQFSLRLSLAGKEDLVTMYVMSITGLSTTFMLAVSFRLDNNFKAYIYEMNHGHLC